MTFVFEKRFPEEGAFGAFQAKARFFLKGSYFVLCSC